ncbi:MAG TPA: hypothetical protein VJZ03_00510 [Candidatus Bathyarchaeia archaeon]|nr:hypothetical protein [Candidatus Bathyarchaeia archaeon]
MKCPLCGKEMSKMSQSTDVEKEMLYYCERHGVMNKGSDLKDKVDQIAKRA